MFDTWFLIFRTVFSTWCIQIELIFCELTRTTPPQRLRINLTSVSNAIKIFCSCDWSAVILTKKFNTNVNCTIRWFCSRTQIYDIHGAIVMDHSSPIVIQNRYRHRGRHRTFGRRGFCKWIFCIEIIILLLKRPRRGNKTNYYFGCTIFER